MTAAPAWTPSPPRYLHRRAVQGVKPSGDLATTIFDLREDRAHLAVYPATVDTFALLIDQASVRMLLTTLSAQDACAVPGTHARHGPRLLGLRPYDAPHSQSSWLTRPADTPPFEGPMELYVHLPHEQIHIVYARDRLTALHDALAEMLSLMR